MPQTYRSRRARLAALTRKLRADGQAWAEIAAVIREAERVNARVAMRLAHGWTQAHVAASWNEHWPSDPATPGLTDKNISYWETWPESGHEPSLRTLKRLAQLYQCDVGDLIDDGSYRHLDERRLPDDAGQGGHAADALPAAPAALAHAAAWLTKPPVRPGAQASALTADNPDEHERLTAALHDARRYLDDSVVEYLRQQLERSKSDDGALGAAQALAPVLTLLEVILRRASEVKPGVRHRLLSLGADGAEFAGWLYRDLRDHERAVYWYDRAMELAQGASDTAMQGYVLLKKSQMAYDERDAPRVAMLAEAAQCGPWQLPTKVRAEVTQQEALGLAMLGDPMDAVQRKMDDARRLFESASSGPGADAFSASITSETLLLRRATCYTEAGKPAHAAALFADVIASAGLSRRDAGFFRARRATALALSGEPDEAASVGLEAVPIAQETNSERTMRVLADASRALTLWHSRPAPRAFKEALAAGH